MTTLIFDILNLNTGYTLRVAYLTRPISFQLKILYAQIPSWAIGHY